MSRGSAARFQMVKRRHPAGAERPVGGMVPEAVGRTCPPPHRVACDACRTCAAPQRPSHRRRHHATARRARARVGGRPRPRPRRRGTARRGRAGRRPRRRPEQRRPAARHGAGRQARRPPPVAARRPRVHPPADRRRDRVGRRRSSAPTSSRCRSCARPTPTGSWPAAASWSRRGRTPTPSCSRRAASRPATARRPPGCCPRARWARSAWPTATWSRSAPAPPAGWSRPWPRPTSRPRPTTSPSACSR